jgi:hypothetical protein
MLSSTSKSLYLPGLDSMLDCKPLRLIQPHGSSTITTAAFLLFESELTILSDIFGHERLLLGEVPLIP